MMKKLLIIFTIIVLLAVGGLVWLKSEIKEVFLSGNALYAVHLNNGQVYFGHLKSVDVNTITLKDVYYLEAFAQAPSNVEANNQISSSKNFQIQPVQQSPKQVYSLARRGISNIYSTDNILFINRQTILFWEKLNNESEITKLIEQNSESKK